MRKSALYERLLDEKDKQVRILTAVLDYERAMRGQPSLPAKISDGPAAVFSPDTPGVIDDGEWISEADEARQILEAQGLSPVHLPEILDGLGIGTSDLS